MNDNTQNILDHSKDELRRIGFDEHPLGNAILKYIEECLTLSDGNIFVQQSLNSLIPALMEKKVVSPITEEDFELVDVDAGNGTKFQLSRCTRYEYLYKSPDDGKYYDDRAVAYVNGNPMNGKMYVYQGGNSSKREVQLPYLPQEEIVYIED